MVSNLHSKRRHIPEGAQVLNLMTSGTFYDRLLWSLKVFYNLQSTVFSFQSAITGEDSFLGVSPQIPAGSAGGLNTIADASLHGGESLSGLSALLDISLPAPVEGTEF